MYLAGDRAGDVRDQSPGEFVHENDPVETDIREGPAESVKERQAGLPRWSRFPRRGSNAEADANLGEFFAGLQIHGSGRDRPAAAVNPRIFNRPRGDLRTKKGGAFRFRERNGLVSLNLPSAGTEIKVLCDAPSRGNGGMAGTD